MCLILAIYLHIDGTSEVIISCTFAATAFLSSVGLLPLPFVLLVDLMPQQIRTMGISICLTTVWLLSFVLYMFGMSAFFNMCVFAYVTAAFCAFAGVVVWIVLPDTVGLSNDEIVQQMEGR